jgi:hypothetical protein
VDLVGQHGAFVHQRDAHVFPGQAGVLQGHAQVLADGVEQVADVLGQGLRGCQEDVVDPQHLALEAQGHSVDRAAMLGEIDVAHLLLAHLHDAVGLGRLGQGGLAADAAFQGHVALLLGQGGGQPDGTGHAQMGAVGGQHAHRASLGARYAHHDLEEAHEHLFRVGIGTHAAGDLRQHLDHGQAIPRRGIGRIRHLGGSGRHADGGNGNVVGIHVTQE